MDIVTENSEQALVALLLDIQKKPDNWLSLHISIAPAHNQILQQEGLSRAAMLKVHKASVQIAQKLFESELSSFDGKIMVFEDSDVLALFLKQSDSLQSILEKLRADFAKNNIVHLLAIEEMSDKLAEIMVLAEEKQQSAEDYRLKKRAVEIGENPSAWSGADPQLAAAIQKKRFARPSSCVLVVEDNVMVRGLLATILGDEHKVVQAKDAASGVVAYIDQAPNIVFLDIHMPGLSGRDTLKRIRQIDPQACVVMVSGDSSSDNILSTKAEGAIGFLRKPFTKQKLQEYIQKCRDLNAEAALKNLGWVVMKSP